MRQMQLTIIIGLSMFMTDQFAASQISGIPPVVSPLPTPTQIMQTQLQQQMQLQRPQSYTDYYMQSLQTYNKPQANVRNYTIDRYFYHNPSLSPYLNLTRKTSPNNLNNYYRYVKPEVDRRNQYSAPKPFPTNPRPMFNSNPYFNHY